MKKTRGSFIKCKELADLPREQTARKFQELAEPSGVIVNSITDKWMPCSEEHLEEAKLDDIALFFKSEMPEMQDTLTKWWLSVPKNANTPNWDITSTCTMKKKKGLILIEAKAHSNELDDSGKQKPSSENGYKNHKHIEIVINQANLSLNRVFPGKWNLSIKSHYQISNRFAWAWKLASLGIPAVLIYLGFLNVTEMKDRGDVFINRNDWERHVKKHASCIIPENIWGKELSVNGIPLWFLIRSIDLSSEN